MMFFLKRQMDGEIGISKHTDGQTMKKFDACRRISRSRSAFLIEKTSKKAFSIVELLVVILGLTILLGVIVNVHISGMSLWNAGYARSDLRTDLTQTLELLSKNIRQATSIDELTQSSITFTADLGAGEDTYKVYLYHASDPEPNPPYTQDSYTLRWVGGSTTYGEGANIAEDIAQPTTAIFTQSGNVITISLTASKGSQSVTMRSKIRPRNL